MQLLISTGMIVLGLVLVTHEHHEFGLFNLAFGAFFLWQGVRRRKRRARSQFDFAGAVSHVDRANELLQQGNTPDQIAEAFDREFHIAPVQTLGFLALDRLGVIGRGQNLAEAAPAMAWLESGKVAHLPEPAALIATLDFRTNVFASSPDVELHPEPGEPAGGDGVLIATRTHLLFFASGHSESVAGETAKEMWIHALPPVIGIANLAKDMVQGVRAELKGGGFGAEVRRDLEKFLKHPASFAVPWRQVNSVGKEEIPAKGPPRMRLVVAHGEPEHPVVTRRLVKGLGLDEEWLDNWVDVVRVCAALEGKLLLF